MINVLLLTDKEKMFIRKEMAKQSDTININELKIQNSVTIFRDSLTKLTCRNDRWDYLRSKQLGTIYSLTNPIFFRNGKLCFIYLVVAGGELIGYSEYIIFKKENKKWVKWITFDVSIS